MKARIAAVVLAAGGSRRMGTPKQLLRYRGRSLLHAAAESACSVADGPVIVVLGASADASEIEVAGLPVVTVRNPSWQRGIGSSIRTGIAVLSDEQVDAVLLMTIDQPLADSDILHALAAGFREGGVAICAAAYAGTLGTPALFARSKFADLLKLCDSEGAKQLLLSEPNVGRVPFPGGEADVDTPDEYQRLLESTSEGKVGANRLRSIP
jgi:molybdenum cofactor cytidylyltransferase